MVIYDIIVKYNKQFLSFKVLYATLLYHIEALLQLTWLEFLEFLLSSFLTYFLLMSQSLSLFFFFIKSVTQKEKLCMTVMMMLIYFYFLRLF